MYRRVGRVGVGVRVRVGAVECQLNTIIVDDATTRSVSRLVSVGSLARCLFTRHSIYTHHHQQQPYFCLRGKLSKHVVPKHVHAKKTNRKKQPIFQIPVRMAISDLDPN